MHSGAIGRNGNRFGIVMPLDGKAGGGKLIVEQADRLLQQTNQVDFFFFALNRAAGHLGKFKQGLYQVAHISRLLIQAEKPLLPFRGQRFLLQKLAIAQNRGQRRAKIMGNI